MTSASATMKYKVNCEKLKMPTVNPTETNQIQI